MKPFTILNRDGLSNNYTDKNYNYAPRPTCDLPNCGSPYLFCDTRARRCVSKVVLGGNCLGFEQFDICYKSICQRGRCVPGAPLISQMTSPTTTPTTTTTRPTTTTTKKTTATTTSTTRSTTKTTAESLTIPDSFFSQATTTEAKTSEITTVAETTSDTATNSTISTTDSFTTESPTLKTAETSTEETTTTAGNKTSSTEISSTTSKSPEITTVTTTESATAAVGSQDIFPDTLWIPVTIVKANGLLASKVPEAKLTSKDAKSGKILEGAVQTRNEYPYYEGIAFAPVESPAKTGHSETLITAMDGDGKKCKSLCYQGKTNVHAYELCDGHIHLDVDRSKSDSLAYTPAKDQTPFLSWDGPVRRPNFLLFVCKLSHKIDLELSESVKSSFHYLSGNADDEEPQRLKDAVANITGLTSAGSTAQENSVTAGNLRFFLFIFLRIAYQKFFTRRIHIATGHDHNITETLQ